jgi:hypothetical protein
MAKNLLGLQDVYLQVFNTRLTPVISGQCYKKLYGRKLRLVIIN